MRLKLSWIEPLISRREERFLETPIAIGRELNRMPLEVAGQSISCLVFDVSEVREYHALIEMQMGQLVAIDPDSTNNMVINGQTCSSGRLKDGDILTISIYKIQINIVRNRDTSEDGQESPDIHERRGDAPDVEIEEYTIDFTEADGASFESEETNFEENMGAS